MILITQSVFQTVHDFNIIQNVDDYHIKCIKICRTTNFQERVSYFMETT